MRLGIFFYVEGWWNHAEIWYGGRFMADMDAARSALQQMENCNCSKSTMPAGPLEKLEIVILHLFYFPAITFQVVTTKICPG